MHPAPPPPRWIWLCLWAGLAFLALSHLQGAARVSPLWWAEPALYALMIAGLWRGSFGLALPAPWAATAFVGLSWAFGMIYELTLSVDGTGLGGMHPDTRASFVLAQGDYIPIALTTLWLIRRWHLDFAGAFLLGCGKSLTEGLVFTGVLTQTLVSPSWPLAPLMLAYYGLAYASFVALPLVVLSPQTLWDRRPPPRPISAPVLIATGFALAFVLRILWGLGTGPLLSWVFGLPPDPAG
jgi:hypothetical protein